LQADALKVTTHVSSVDVSDNQITDVGAAALIPVLSAMESLKE
jgi:hypothetical protein